ncbi:type II toxin-antitoxin system Phd/YefM family antitoxin [Mycobacterium kubicae]|uniref:type II toxin-antitoxin system Phd/YefM family antitoxin n=1 Tax=Mycobacterium kubicae TaxID=120959 RepID=UPI0016412B88|nr:type II toxin-antitoxin system Phd/YefM family antitoxin [Mycobacterium kubicae]QNI07746.1 type II toxin-antitoxin system Phd/YefM family antitoxin [Mycobacterium kubicae]
MRSVPLTEATEKLPALVDAVANSHEIICITRHGRALAILMSAEDLESLQATLHALQTPGLTDDLARADAAYVSGATVHGDALRRHYGLP